MNRSNSEHVDVLLSHSAWIRRLAESLVGDPHMAEDIAQDTLAAAVEQRPRRTASLRGWLASLVRNFARQRWRQELRRERREFEAARAEAIPSHDDLIARLDVHRAVLEDVSRLGEPYRTAILMRYIEGLTPAAIAERTQIPVRTVHSHLHRGLEQLRARLDDRHAERGVWLLALLPLEKQPSGLVAIRIGASVMDPKLTLGLVAVGLAGLLSLVWIGWPGTADDPIGSESMVVAAPEPAPVAPAAAGASIGARTAETPRAPTATTASPLDSAQVRGWVVDVHDRARAHFDVRLVATDESVRTTRSDGAGFFEFRDVQSARAIDSAMPDAVTVLRPLIKRGLPLLDDRDEHVLVVAPTLSFAGHVRTATGEPVVGATVRLLVDESILRSRMSRVVASTILLSWQARSNEDGWFELPRVPALDFARLSVTARGLRSEQRPLPDISDLRMEFVLPSSEPVEQTIQGRVVDAGHRPVEGAHVTAGEESVTSEADGGFTLTLPAGDSAHALQAVKRGHLPARVERQPGTPWPSSVVLTLGGSPLALTGRVVEADATPLRSARVWLAEATDFGMVHTDELGFPVQLRMSLEQLLSADPLGQRIETDDDGRFRIEGLLPRDYTISVLEPRSMRVERVGPVAAGGPAIDVRFAADRMHARVAGTLRARSGAPRAGARVFLARWLDSPGADAPSERIESEARMSDSDGRFEFRNIAQAVTELVIRDESIDFNVSVDLRSVRDLEHIEIEVPLRCHIQVHLGASRVVADRFSLLDAHGRPLRLVSHRGNIAAYLDDCPIVDGRSEPVVTSELAATLVLHHDGNAVERVPIRLTSGELNVLRP